MNIVIITVIILTIILAITICVVVGKAISNTKKIEKDVVEIIDRINDTQNKIKNLSDASEKNKEIREAISEVSASIQKYEGTITEFNRTKQEAEKIIRDLFLHGDKPTVKNTKNILSITKEEQEEINSLINNIISTHKDNGEISLIEKIRKKEMEINATRQSIKKIVTGR